MAKLESAAEVIAIIKSGKYENEVNAKRGVGRTRLSKSEKAEVFKFIESYFGGSGAAKTSGQGLRPGKRMAKKVSKKVARKKVTHQAPEVEEVDEEETEGTDDATETPRKTSKKAGRTKGVLAISPSEVKTVADVLQVVDSTVQGSVRVLSALKQADEISKEGDITRGVQLVKQSLEGAAQVLHSQVVMPLLNSNQGSDQAVASRLEAVVAASTALPIDQQHLMHNQ